MPTLKSASPSFIYPNNSLLHFFKMPANRTEGCCVNQRVNSDPGGAVLKHSCSLTVADPGNLLLELLPNLNARTFKANQHSEWTENSKCLK